MGTENRKKQKKKREREREKKEKAAAHYGAADATWAAARGMNNRGQKDGPTHRRPFAITPWKAEGRQQLRDHSQESGEGPEETPRRRPTGTSGERQKGGPHPSQGDGAHPS